MAERDLPEGTANSEALSHDEGAEAIFDLIKDPVEPDPNDKSEKQDAEDITDDDIQTDEADEAEDEGTETGDDDADADDDPVDEEGEDETEDAESAVSFASDTAKVRMDDGSEVTVSDLKRNNLFQQDYSRKTQELTADRQKFTENERVVTEHAQKLVQQREELLSISEALLPQPPDKAMRDDDPYGYSVAKEDYDDRMKAINKLQQDRQKEYADLQEKHVKEQDEFRKAEAGKMFEAMPDLKDPKAYSAFWSDASDVMTTKYGFTQDELENATDHRMYRVFRDVIKYHKAQKKVSKGNVKADLKTKPVLTGKKRMSKRAKDSNATQQRAERLRTTGTLEAAVDTLKDFDL